MRAALFKSLSLVGVTGSILIGTILLFLFLGVALTFFLRGRYARLERELRQRGDEPASFESRVLARIAREALEALRRHPHDINTPAIVDSVFQDELQTYLVAERFIRALTGLMIILGLVGTFYGLTLSIGKLVALVSGDLTGSAAITESLISGLTEALSGMSVAFSTSLFGIMSAITMTLLGVFVNVTDRRSAVMVQIEAYIDNVLLGAARGAGDVGLAAPVGSVAGPRGAELERAVRSFEQSVARLDGAVAGFQQALTAFSTSTRDFHEFNHHLKDNIQRMSLSFGDLSETLKRELYALRGRDRG